MIITCGTALSFPTPIPPPKQTYVEACELVLKKYADLTDTEMPPKWRDTRFPQFVTYTTFQFSPALQDHFKHAFKNKEEIKKSKYAFLVEEYGWLITVVFAHDLSQSDTYFVRPSGEVKLLWTTD